MPTFLNISSDSVHAWYFFSQTTLVIPHAIKSMAQVLQGVILQYTVAHWSCAHNFAA